MALTVIAIAGGLFALLGTIERIVTFASLMFLLVFAVVNYIYWITVVIWLASNSMNALILSIAITLALAACRFLFLKYRGERDREDTSFAANQSVDRSVEPEDDRETALNTRK